MSTFEPDILFEDNHLLVINKPVGISVQDDQSGKPDLLTLLKIWLKMKYDKPGNVFLGLVHRLDQPVGGVMVFAKTSKGASRLSEQVRTHRFQKIYWAVVHGLPAKEGHLRHFLLKDEKTNIVSCRDQPFAQAKEARLRYKVIKSSQNVSLLEIELETGRPHQIRAQFAHIGHPLCGDQRYGKKDGYPNIALHAYRLGLQHPTKDEQLAFECKPDPHQAPWKSFLKS